MATADGDRRSGHLRTDDGLLDADLRAPKGLDGSGGATNPEQLFAAGYAACFLSALKATKAEHGVAIKDASVVAGRVSICGRSSAGPLLTASSVVVMFSVSVAFAASIGLVAGVLRTNRP